MLADCCYMSVPERMLAVTATSTDDSRAIERFLRAIERRALRMAEFATSNREEALDVVQDAIVRLRAPLWRTRGRRMVAVVAARPPGRLRRSLRHPAFAAGTL
jgi:hypothetical protein